MTMSKSDEENHRRAQHINDIGALNAAASAHQRRRRRQRDRNGEKKMKTNASSDGTIEDQSGEKINFIVKLRKLLCIFGQSFRLSSINCRYYWAIAFIIFIESFSSSSRFSPVLSACGSLFISGHRSYHNVYIVCFSIRACSLVHFTTNLAIPSLSTPFMKEYIYKM